MADTKVKVEQCSFGVIWIMGWLFTLGFLKLAFWKGVLALLVWPYYIGEWVGNIK
ncbi:MAG: hypothetical protein R6W90_09700 [Ignavibacteriaceae bacterium]